MTTRIREAPGRWERFTRGHSRRQLRPETSSKRVECGGEIQGLTPRLHHRGARFGAQVLAGWVAPAKPGEYTRELRMLPRSWEREAQGKGTSRTRRTQEEAAPRRSRGTWRIHEASAGNEPVVR